MKDKSPLVELFKVFYKLLWYITPIAWIEKLSKQSAPYWCMEAWVVSVLLLQTLFLFHPYGTWLSVFLSIYVLLTLIGSLLRDVVSSLSENRDSEGGYVSIRDEARWFILAFISMGQVILSFAILILVYKDSFSPEIPDSITALYLSMVTFTTLGYGDIKPVSVEAQVIVITELFFFLAFLGIRLPLAISVLRVKSRLEKKRESQ